MLEIIYGKSGSGKTDMLLKKAVRGAKNGRVQYIFVPETKTFEAEKELLSMFESGSSPNAQVMSMTRFAKNLLGDGREEYIEKASKLLLCKKACDKARSSFKYYQKGTDKGGFYRKLMESFDEFVTSGVSGEQLLKAAEDNVCGQDVGDIAAAYIIYLEELKNYGIDDGDGLKKAAEKVAESGVFKDCELYFDGYTGFTSSEYKMIEAMAKSAASLSFAVMTDRKSDIFLEQNRTVSRLERLAERTGHDVKLTICEKSETDETAMLAEKIFSFEKTSVMQEGKTEFIRAADMDEECAYVASLIRKAVMTENMRYRDIAVACGDVEGYESALERAFRQRDIPLYTSDKSELMSKPPAAAVLGALQAVQRGFGCEQMFYVLKSGLSGVDEDTVCKMENYVLSMSLKGRDWQREWTKPAVDFGERIEENKLAELSELNEGREKIIVPLSALKENLAKAEKGSDYAAAVRQYIADTNLETLLEQKIKELYDNELFRESMEYGQVYEKLCAVLETFEKTEQDEDMNTDQFCELLSIALSNCSIAAVPVVIDQVIFTDFRNLPMKRPKLLFMIGCSEGNFPKETAGQSLISENDRVKLSKTGIELSLTAEERYIEMESHIYRGFAMPKEKLYLSYSQKDRSGRESRASYIYNRAKRLLNAQETAVADTKGQYRLWHKNTIMDAACEYISGSVNPASQTAYDSVARDKKEYLESIKSTGKKLRGPITDRELIKALYGEKLSLSASKIEKIASCPFAFFMEYGLKAAERRKINFDARAIGSFMHELVEHAVKAYIDKGRDGVDGAIEESYKKYAERLGREKEISAMLKITMDNIVENSKYIISDIIDEIERSDFKPVKCELTFGDSGNDAYKFTRDGLEVSVRGKIDRVDAFEKDGEVYLKVVDYKTGTKKFKLSDIVYGFNVQMFLYMMMLCEIENTEIFKDSKKQSAAVMYLPLRSIYREAEPDEDEEKAGGKREGFVLKDREIVEALEHSQDGKYTYVPVSVKKDGEFSATSNVLAENEFSAVFSKIKRQLFDIADRINTGFIEPLPVIRDLQTNSCSYCPFHAACLFDESMGTDKMKKIKGLKTDEAIAAMGEE